MESLKFISIQCEVIKNPQEAEIENAQFHENIETKNILKALNKSSENLENFENSENSGSTGGENHDYLNSNENEENLDTTEMNFSVCVCEILDEEEEDQINHQMDNSGFKILGNNNDDEDSKFKEIYSFDEFNLEEMLSFENCNGNLNVSIIPDDLKNWEILELNHASFISRKSEKWESIKLD